MCSKAGLRTSSTGNHVSMQPVDFRGHIRMHHDVTSPGKCLPHRLPDIPKHMMVLAPGPHGLNTVAQTICPPSIYTVTPNKWSHCLEGCQHMTADIPYFYTYIPGVTTDSVPHGYLLRLEEVTILGQLACMVVKETRHLRDEHVHSTPMSILAGTESVNVYTSRLVLLQSGHLRSIRDTKLSRFLVMPMIKSESIVYCPMPSST